MTTVGSIGIGLLMLIVVWIVALAIFVIAVKLQSNLAWIALITAALITITLVSFPVEKHNSESLNLIVEVCDHKKIFHGQQNC